MKALKIKTQEGSLHIVKFVPNISFFEKIIELEFIEGGKVWIVSDKICWFYEIDYKTKNEIYVCQSTSNIVNQ